MATVYITEFGNAGSASGNLPIALFPALGEQTITLLSSASTACTSGFGTASVMIRVHTDTNCFIALSSSPTATTASARLAANQTEYFGINSNGNLKLAAIST